MLPCDMDDNTLLTLDFGQSLFGFVYGTAAGGLPDIGRFAIFGLNGSIRSGKLNGQPIDYPESQLEEESGSNASLPVRIPSHTTHPYWSELDFRPVWMFFLPALQTQTNPPLYPNTVIVIKCLNVNASPIDYLIVK